MKHRWEHFTRIWFTRAKTPLYSDSHSKNKTLIFNGKIDFLIVTKSTDALLF